MTRRGRAAALAAMCVGMFLVLLDVTVVNVALPAIADDTAASIARLQGSWTAARCPSQPCSWSAAASPTRTARPGWRWSGSR